VYDPAGRTSQLKRGATVLTAYTYTIDTNLIATRTDGTQGTVAFTWDWAGRQTVIDPPDTYVAGTVTRSYRLDGLLASQSFPSSITETLAYDAAKRPTSISLGAAGSISQAFDRAGSVTSDGRSLSGITGDAGTNTQSFSYDALHRLTGSTGLAASRSYQYDLDGNRTRRVEGTVTTDYLYDRADQLQQQTIGATTRTFDYDRYGNLLSSWDGTNTQTTYGYDEASRLVAVNPPGGAPAAIGFTLDALDRPATRTTGGSTTDNYGYVGATETAYLTGSATTTGALLDAEGTRLAVKTGSAVSWLLFDLHGSVAAICPAGSSTLSDAYRYDGWGNLVASAGTAVNPYRYRGLLNLANDVGAGALLAMGAREYAPQLGTFTQQDSYAGSAANPASMNRFLYALANPATLIDPDGHMACLDVGTKCATSGDLNTYVSTRRVEATKPTPDIQIPNGVDPRDLVCDLSCELSDQLAPVDENFADYFSTYTLCGTAATGLVIGNPGSHLTCLHSHYGQELGDAIFLRFYRSEYDDGIDSQIRQAAVLVLTAYGIAQLVREAGATVRLRLPGGAEEAGSSIGGTFFSSFGRARVVQGAGGSAQNGLRSPNDVEVSGRAAPDILSLSRRIGYSPWQESSKDALIKVLQRLGAEDVRVNQWQVDASGSVVGRNRPDLQFTIGGRRYYVEWDNNAASNLIHENRILLNDPSGQFVGFL
jgi:RHS repeat-associated protein